METFFKNMRGILAITVVILGFGFLYLLLFLDVPPSNKDVVMLTSGIIVATITAITAYYFGSSKDKSDSEKAAIEKDKIEAQNGNP